MKKTWLFSTSGLILLFIAFWIFMPTSTERDGVGYWKGRVVESQTESGVRKVELLSGPQEGQTVTTNISSTISSLDMTPPNYDVGSIVFVSHNIGSDNISYYAVVDYYRISAGVWVLFFVILIAVIFAGWRGFGALLGLMFSILVIGQFLIPNIVDGKAPYLITALAIMLISLPGIFISHGLNKRTALALLSCYITLALAVLLSLVAVYFTRLSGISDENIMVITQLKPELNIHGLMFCGLLISLVGILDDITVGQTVTIYELKLANSKLSFAELYKRGIRVGREHIASLINTLVLVYVGASFLFIVYLAIAMPYPLLMILNSEFMMEEIVRSLVGSASLILAVPIATALAAYFLRSEGAQNKKRVTT